MGRRRAWADNDRLRRDGTRVLVDAALAAGVPRFVFPGIVFVYPDGGDRWIDAADTPPRGADDLTRSSLEAEAEVARFTAAGGRGIVLRLGPLYGPDTPSTATQLALLRLGVAPLFGAGGAYTPSLWTEDAGSALVAALGPAVPAGVYDVVDDEPLTRRELARVMADAAGRRRALRPPMAAVRLTMPAVVTYIGLSQRVSNWRFKAVSGWRPRVLDARDGWRRIARTLAAAPTGQGTLVRAARPWLLVLLLVALPLGLWAQALPHAFYETFPGLGHAWVSGDGPYNEHLLRDFGSLNLALATVMLCALLRPTRELVRVAALAALVGGVPHFVYHAVHLDLLPSTADAVVQTIALAVPVAVGLALLRTAAPRRRAAAPGHVRREGVLEAAS
jgi:nucleoside-diphosphate-sugar epimerase